MSIQKPILHTSHRRKLLLSEATYSTTEVGTSVSDGTGSNADNNDVARIVFVAGDCPSGYGRTSPEPDPSWSIVAAQLSRRLPNFGGQNSDGDDKISATWLHVSDLQLDSLMDCDVAVALGVASSPSSSSSLLDYEAKLEEALEYAGSDVKAFIADPTCGERTLGMRFVDEYRISNAFHNILAEITPWSSMASGKRLLKKTETLLARKSSEDYIFSVLFVVHALVVSLDVVKSDINPSWEKGVVRNVQEFQTMVNCCGPEIQSALTDPQTKNAIDLLNAVDLRDQVGSYRVIVSNETPQLEDFTLCILQQNNCFQCDAPILDKPRVPVLKNWPGKQVLSEEASKQILIGHLDHPDAHPVHSQRKPWSWKIVVGANPAYDAFPMQHQIFYPVGGESKDGNTKAKSLWYDPVFCVETLNGDRVWCKRHYRCTPRRHWSASDNSDDNNSKWTPGAWTLNTLDNGMVSEEKWTTVDAADDLSWAVLHYSGAARRAGQSYVGALLCTADGHWPESCRDGVGLERIRSAFQKCDLELWELFGGSTDKSYMWSEKYINWKEQNPPPLDRIGDMSITKWRKLEREKQMKQ